MCIRDRSTWGKFTYLFIKKQTQMKNLASSIKTINKSPKYFKSLNTQRIQPFGQRVLHIYDNPSRQSVSGIRATIFGGTGFLGPYVGSALGYLSSDLIFPHNHVETHDDELKELRLCSNVGQTFLVRDMNFDDPKMIERVIQNSNVVINLLGPRKTKKYRKDFEYANIELPKRIAQACAKNPNVARFIHFSCAGVSKDSPSLDLQTKWHGEQEVREAFPGATIFRPSVVTGRHDYFIRHWITNREFFQNFTLVFDNCEAKRQPIYVGDIGLCVLNALKLPETAGRTYELGGPQVYTIRECMEIMYNIIGREPKLAYFQHDIARSIAKYLINWQFFNLDNIIKNTQDMIVSPDARKIDELCVTPVSFPIIAQKCLWDNRARYPGDKDEFER
eukprot:TRINITY_DN1580_c0_g1_i4.p1 TRINITY_DN1580_c0_g1~~TRINITY_DN1580_c0_g1_i4.p1  ORF type:complete len:390 (-),score=36.38 TRINITY_DN1580_c0_g1_i4:96-1265(-)